MSTRRDRSLDTRARVLQCAVDLLVERGLDGFTTPAVAACSDVAQGTVFRNFPTKDDLLVATVEIAIQAATTDHATALAERLEASPPPDAPALARTIVEALWGAYTDDRVVACYEVRARSRTNPELQAKLRGILESSDVGGSDIISLLVPDSFRATSDGLRSLSRLVTSAMQGRAFTRASLPDPGADESLLASLTDAVAAHLVPAPPDVGAVSG